MLSPSQVERLQDEFDKFVAVLVVGSLIFLVGSTMGVFASQDLLYGTNFMMRLAGAEQGLGLLLIAVGGFKANSLHKQLNQPATSHVSSRSTAAGAGH
ncbi:MAG TPA: hypothetical protein VFM77_11805 [Terriglobales bacterium]|nr:hypothetical protein [Terriglobales bacterium]